MQKNLLSLAVILCLSTLYLRAQTMYPSGVSGCIARWTFDSQKGMALTNINDESGNSHHGTNHDITTTDGWKGLPYTAGKFNGISSYAQVPFTNLGTSQLTTVALIKFEGFYSGSCQGNNIIHNGFNYNSDLNWALYTTDQNYDNNCSSYNPTKNEPNFVTPNGINNGVPTSDFIESNEWYFIASSYDGTNVRYYQIQMDPAHHINNIVPSYTEINNGGLGTNNYDIFIGATPNPSFPYWFNGAMDEIILFNKALTDNEIQSVYDYLYGYTTSITNNSAEQKSIFVTINNEQCIINTKLTRFNYEIYNSIGQIVARKSNCSNIEMVDLSSLSSQMLFVKVLDDKNKMYYFKINLQK